MHERHPAPAPVTFVVRFVAGGALASVALFLAGCGSGDDSVEAGATRQTPGSSTQVTTPTTAGPDDDEIAPGPEASNETHDDAAIGGPPIGRPHAEEFARPQPGDGAATFAANDNLPDGTLGSLCWARWEVDRRIHQGVLGLEPKDATLAGLGNDLESIRARVHEGRSATDSPEVRSFADQFLAGLDGVTGISQLGTARLADTQMTELIDLFDFESYPGVQAYADAAMEQPSCVTP